MQVIDGKVQKHQYLLKAHEKANVIIASRWFIWLGHRAQQGRVLADDTDVFLLQTEAAYMQSGDDENRFRQKMCWCQSMC